jgi:7-cyano-7-deazaguanine synthase
VARALGAASHRVVRVDLSAFGGSALTDAAIAVPKGRSARAMAAEIPVTYVPARNTIFLSFALALAEVRGANDIFIGVNAIDYSGYPDCRPEFVAAFEVMANLATKAAVEYGAPIAIAAPLINLSKGEIVRLGVGLGVDYSHTVSCYDADRLGGACGACDSCVIRRRGFEEAGVTDPTRYALVS